jgi:hypothetical protein
MPHELLFCSTEKSEINTTLRVKVNSFNELAIQIAFKNALDEFDTAMVVALDKQDAIRLVKEIRKHISFLEG